MSNGCNRRATCRRRRRRRSRGNTVNEITDKTPLRQHGEGLFLHIVYAITLNPHQMKN